MPSKRKRPESNIAKVDEKKRRETQASIARFFARVMPVNDIDLGLYYECEKATMK